MQVLLHSFPFFYSNFRTANTTAAIIADKHEGFGHLQ